MRLDELGSPKVRHPVGEAGEADQRPGFRPGAEPRDRRTQLAPERALPRSASLPADDLLARNQLRPRADFMQQGGRFERRLAAADDRNASPFETLEVIDLRRVGHQVGRQGGKDRRDLGVVGESCRHHHAASGDGFAILQRHREAVGASFDAGDIDRFDPRHMRLLKPSAIVDEIRDRAWLERLQAARRVVVGEREAGRRGRDVGAEAKGLQVSVATGVGDLRPKFHCAAEYPMPNPARGEMGRQRQAIGPSADNCDIPAAHEELLSTWRAAAETRRVELRKRGIAFKPR